MSNPNWFKDLFIDEAKPALHGSPAGSGGNVGGSADWNQNDSAKPGYIKNRPFFTKSVERVSVLSETTIDVNREEDGVAFGDIGGAWIYLEIGKTYSVVLNGKTYECVARALPIEWGMNGSVLGNGSLGALDAEGNNEPFCIAILDEMRLQQIAVSIDLKGTNTLSIETIQEDIQHIDPKYIKDMYSDNRTYRVIEGTVTGEVDGNHIVKIIDNIDFDITKVKTASLYTSEGYSIKDVPVIFYDDIIYTDHSNPDESWPLFWRNTQDNSLCISDDSDIGTSIEVNYSLSVADGKLNKLKPEYSPVIEKTVDMVFYEDILDTNLFEGSYTRIKGKALVWTDEGCETVMFTDEGGSSYAGITHCSWLYSIEIYEGGVLLTTNLDGQTEHYLEIDRITETIKNQYLPSDVAKKQDIENAIEQLIGPENQPVSIPVYQATSTDGKNYDISIGRNPKAGDLFVIVPNMDSAFDSNADVGKRYDLRINGKYYILAGRYLYGGGFGAIFGHERVLKANYPVLISMLEGNGKLYALMVGTIIDESHKIKISEIKGDANDPIKRVSAPYIDSLVNGVELYASVWGATNTAENPTLALNLWDAKPIVDKNGEPIAPDVLVESCLYHFIYYKQKWILVDKLS